MAAPNVVRFIFVFSFFVLSIVFSTAHARPREKVLAWISQGRFHLCIEVPLTTSNFANYVIKRLNLYNPKVDNSLRIAFLDEILSKSGGVGRSLTALAYFDRYLEALKAKEAPPGEIRYSIKEFIVALIIADKALNDESICLTDWVNTVALAYRVYGIPAYDQGRAHSLQAYFISSERSFLKEIGYNLSLKPRDIEPYLREYVQLYSGHPCFLDARCQVQFVRE